MFLHVCVCRLVVDVLKGVEGGRRCFRLVGGVLVERTVKEVLPALERNNEQVWLCNNTHTLFISLFLSLSLTHTLSQPFSVH